jgi:hypothetical protein
MPIGNHRPLQTVRYLMAVCAVCVILAGCGLEHVRLLREAQQEFSALASVETSQAMRMLFPPTAATGQHIATAKAPAQIWLPGADKVEALVSLHRGYFELYQRLRALENRAGGQLKADGLAGATATLRVLAHWRTLFYAHVLSVEEALPPLTTEPPPLPKTLTEIIAEANRLLNDKNLTLYPRDQFMLRALRPLIRYELVYIRIFDADRQHRLPQDTSGIPLVTPWIEAIAQAATELTAINEAQYRHMASYQTLALLAMLRSAQRLVIQVGLNPATEAQRFPTLAQAIHGFHTTRASDPALQQLFRDGIKLQEVLPRMTPQ